MRIVLSIPMIDRERQSAPSVHQRFSCACSGVMEKAIQRW